MFSATFRYALISLLEIAASDGGINATDIARRHQISAPYLANVLSDLRRLGLIKSQKGRRGGYQLLRQPQDINLFLLQQGLAGSPPVLAATAPHPALQWLDAFEQRCQAELAATNLQELSALIQGEHAQPQIHAEPQS